MSPVYNPGAIKDKTTTYSITLWEVDDAFAVASPFVSFSMGHLADSARFQEANSTEYPDETGEVVASDETYVMKVTATLMETSKSIIDFVGKTVKTKFYGLTYRRDDVDGLKQEWFFGRGKVKAQFNQSTPGGTSSMKFEYTAYSNKAAAVTLATALLASMGAYVTLTQTIPIREGFVITENA